MCTSSEHSGHFEFKVNLEFYFTIIIFSVFVIPPAFITAMYIPFAWLEASHWIEKVPVSL